MLFAMDDGIIEIFRNQLVSFSYRRTLTNLVISYQLILEETDSVLGILLPVFSETFQESEISQSTLATSLCNHLRTFLLAQSWYILVDMYQEGIGRIDYIVIGGISRLHITVIGLDILGNKLIRPHHHRLSLGMRHRGNTISQVRYTCTAPGSVNTIESSLSRCGIGNIIQIGYHMVWFHIIDTAYQVARCECER